MDKSQVAQPENIPMVTFPETKNNGGEVSLQGTQVNSVRGGTCVRGNNGLFYNWETTCNFNGGVSIYAGGGYNGNFNVRLTG